jgi:hypothetical protein
VQNYGMAFGYLKDTGNILVKTTQLVITGWASGFPANVRGTDSVVCLITAGQGPSLPVLEEACLFGALAVASC